MHLLRAAGERVARGAGGGADRARTRRSAVAVCLGRGEAGEFSPGESSPGEFYARSTENDGLSARAQWCARSPRGRPRRHVAFLVTSHTRRGAQALWCACGGRMHGQEASRGVPRVKRRGCRAPGLFEGFALTHWATARQTPCARTGASAQYGFSSCAPASGAGGAVLAPTTHDGGRAVRSSGRVDVCCVAESAPRVAVRTLCGWRCPV